MIVYDLTETEAPIASSWYLTLRKLTAIEQVYGFMTAVQLVW